MALEDRFKSVEARCSGFAQELLRQLQHDAQLAELLAELEKRRVDAPFTPRFAKRAG